MPSTLSWSRAAFDLGLGLRELRLPALQFGGADDVGIEQLLRARRRARGEAALRESP